MLYFYKELCVKIVHNYKKKAVKWVKKCIATKFLLVFTLFMAFFVTGCEDEAEGEATSSKPADKTEIQSLDVPYEEFRKIVGWIGNGEILVHLGDTENDALAVYNIHNGNMQTFYESSSYILTVELSKDLDKIAVQLIEGDASEVEVIDLEGNVKQTKELPASGYIGMDWNPEDDNMIFLSYPEFIDGEETIVLENWMIDVNETTRIETASLETRWYSSNLYLYIDHNGDHTLENGELYIGDIRNDETLLINSQVSNFYLNENSFVGMTTSDFNEEELLLTLESPFLVEQGFLTVPKVTMNERLVFPYLSQGSRNGPVYGVMPKERILLEETVGEYELTRLDFEEQTTDTLMDLPTNAPILVSNNEKYSLYGWQYEYVIDLSNETIHSLIPNMNPAS